MKRAIVLLTFTMLAGCGASATVVLAGCGESSKPNPSVAKPNPSARFLARADAICIGQAKRVSVLIRKSAQGPPMAEIATMRARTARELSVLKPPPALKPLYLQLVSAIAREAAIQRRVDEDLRKHEYTAGVLASFRKLRGNAVSRPARLIGLTDCV
jgi:hypothetical protein